VGVGTWVRAHRGAVALLAVITVVAGALRAGAAASPSRYQSVDERAYARLARNLARHGRYTDPAMSEPVRWPPGAPAVFALAHELRPATRADGRWDVPAAYPVQAALGTALVPVTFALAALLGGAAAGLVAAGAIALYPPLVSASGDLLTEPLGALLLVAGLLATVLALRRPGVARGAVAGAVLGLAVLVRADLLLLPFALAALALVLVWRAAGRGAAARTALAMALAPVVVLAPWSVYASSQAGRFTPVSSGGPSNLYVGTFVPGGGSMFGLKRAWAPEVRRRFARYRDAEPFQIPQTRVMDVVAARHPGLDRQDALRAAALENVRRHVLGDPAGFAAMAVRKVERLWLGSSRGTYRTERPATRAVHLLLVAFGALGLAAGLVRRRAPELWIPCLAVLYVTALNVVLVAEPRHNLPVMPVLVAGGAAGLALAAQRVPRFTAAMRSGATLLRRS
jgi:4-amino-4-deoxy-L-arabinose transferase-like glycosyltransferase